MPATFNPTLFQSSKDSKKMGNRQIEVTATFNPYQLKILIKGELPAGANSLMTSNRMKHYRVSQEWQRLVREPSLLFKPDKPLDKFNIKVVRHSHKMLDYDNLVTSLKPCLDALKSSKKKGPGVITDDRWSCTGQWNVNQEFRSKKDGSVLEIIITEE